MIFDMNRMVVELEYRGIVPVENATGTRIDCLRGRIWITEQGCAGDTVLEAGQSYDIARDGVAVVQALREALVAFCAPAVAQAGAGSRRGSSGSGAHGVRAGLAGTSHCAAGLRLTRLPTSRTVAFKAESFRHFRTGHRESASNGHFR